MKKEIVLGRQGIGKARTEMEEEEMKRNVSPTWARCQAGPTSPPTRCDHCFVGGQCRLASEDRECPLPREHGH